MATAHHTSPSSRNNTDTQFSFTNAQNTHTNHTSAVSNTDNVSPTTSLLSGASQDRSSPAARNRRGSDRSWNLCSFFSSCFTCLWDGITRCCRRNNNNAQPQACYENGCVRFGIELGMTAVACGVDVMVDELYELYGNPNEWHHFVASFGSVLLATLFVIGLHSRLYASREDQRLSVQNVQQDIDQINNMILRCLARTKQCLHKHYFNATIILLVPGGSLSVELIIATVMHDWDTSSMKAHALDRSILYGIQFLLTMFMLRVDQYYCVRKINNLERSMSMMLELEALNNEVDNHSDNADNGDDDTDNIRQQLTLRITQVVQEVLNQRNDDVPNGDGNNNHAANNVDVSVFVKIDEFADQLEQKESRQKIDLMIDGKLENVATMDSVNSLQMAHNELNTKHNQLDKKHNDLDNKHKTLDLSVKEISIAQQSLASQDDIKTMVTQDEMKEMVTQQQLKQMAEKLMQFMKPMKLWMEQQKMAKNAQSNIGDSNESSESQMNNSQKASTDKVDTDTVV